MEVSEVDRIINAVAPGWRVVAVTVPTRALRVITDDLSLTFRVEQFNSVNWTWRVVSFHAGDEAWESFGPAVQDAITKQARLKEKIKLAQHDKRMAMVKAQNPVLH